jgi:pimeloyl-ACP methyl ester carboxylesterase
MFKSPERRRQMGKRTPWLSALQNSQASSSCNSYKVHFAFCVSVVYVLITKMSLPKPTILLIPGAWHRGSTFEPVAALLRTQGYPVETITLLSVGGPTSTTVADDAAYIQKRYLDDLISQEKEVVVVMHSYGGIPGTESVQGRTRRDIAAQGKKGGVVALVYMAAFLISAGQSVDSFLPGGAASIMDFEVS